MMSTFHSVFVGESWCDSDGDDNKSKWYPVQRVSDCMCPNYFCMQFIVDVYTSHSPERFMFRLSLIFVFLIQERWELCSTMRVFCLLVMHAVFVAGV